MAAVLEARLLEAQSERLVPIDLVSTLVELTRRSDRLLERRIKEAQFRDGGKTVDTFDLDFNNKMSRRLVYELADSHVQDAVNLYNDNKCVDRFRDADPNVPVHP
jgi:hypothetical protein